jgi:sorbitol-specific phosphotransferase system component IIA
MIIVAVLLSTILPLFNDNSPDEFARYDLIHTHFRPGAAAYRRFRLYV